MSETMGVKNRLQSSKILKKDVPQFLLLKDKASIFKKAMYHQYYKQSHLQGNLDENFFL